MGAASVAESVSDVVVVRCGGDVKAAGAVEGAAGCEAVWGAAAAVVVGGCVRARQALIRRGEGLHPQAASTY